MYDPPSQPPYKTIWKPKKNLKIFVLRHEKLPKISKKFDTYSYVNFSYNQKLNFTTRFSKAQIYYDKCCFCYFIRKFASSWKLGDQNRQIILICFHFFKKFNYLEVAQPIDQVDVRFNNIRFTSSTSSSKEFPRR